MFRSQTNETQEDWKILMPDVNKTQLQDIKFDSSSQHFISSYLKQEKLKKNVVPCSSNSEKINQILQGEERFEPDEVIRI